MTADPIEVLQEQVQCLKLQLDRCKEELAIEKAVTAAQRATIDRARVEKQKDEDTIHDLEEFLELLEIEMGNLEAEKAALIRRLDQYMHRP